jgi:hypothetical protein
MSSFVDDTNASLNDRQPQHQMEIEALLTMVAHDAQIWNNLLFVSGGKLELSKCSFHILQFQFRPDGTPYPDLAAPPPIKLKDSVSHESIIIHSLPANQPHKTLGHWKSPAGKQSKQLQEIQKKAKSTSMLIFTSPIFRYGKVYRQFAMRLTSVYFFT